MTLALARLWIAASAYLVLAGWSLSLLHALNRTGYAVALLVGVGLGWRCGGGVFLVHCRWPRFRRRFRRVLPLGFLLLLCGVLAGGTLYFPGNYDALSYRIPRTLHWLGHEQWHWIHTADVRLNTRAAGCEWMMAPVLLFLRSERIVWLANAGIFAMLPGLIYSLFAAVGANRRVAWQLMWLLPTGYVFHIQAGGDSNDLPGVFFALAALVLALRARAKASASDLLLGAIAAALATGVKLSNAPLVLPWLVAAIPSWRLAFTRPVLLAGGAMAAAGCSFLPNAVMNARHLGEWSGAKAEVGAAIIDAPAWVHAAGNLISLTVQNFTPPVFPFAAQWNAVAGSLVPPALAARLATGLQEGDHLWIAYEIPTEDSAALGPFLVLMLAALMILSLRKPPVCRSAWMAAVRWSPWVSFAAFLAKMSLLATGRLAAPYYLLLPMPFLVRRGVGEVVRARWWRGLAILQVGSAIVVLIISPARPLWPALTVLRALPQRLTESRPVQRMYDVYSRYRKRPDILAPVRALIPPEARKVGLVTLNDLETSLWRPFGARQFEHILPGDTRELLAAQGIEYAILSERAFRVLMKGTLPAWVESLGAEVLGSVTVATHVSEPPVQWHLIQLSKTKPLPHGAP